MASRTSPSSAKSAALRGREARRMRRELERRVTVAMQQQIKAAVHDNFPAIAAAIEAGCGITAAVQVAAPNTVQYDPFTGQAILTPTTTPPPHQGDEP